MGIIDCKRLLVKSDSERIVTKMLSFRPGVDAGGAV